MIKIVIVEDEMLVRLGMKVCLEEYSSKMQVVEASGSAEEALTYLEHNKADVLITDIRLTGMSGLELIEAVRLSDINMSILVLSCYEEFSYARQAMELGVDKYLLKHELVGDDLPKLVEEVVEARQMVRYEQEEDVLSGSMWEAVSKDESIQEKIMQVAYLVLRGADESRNAGSDLLAMKMLVEIIQKILNIHAMGECFLRHGEELFIIFQFETAGTGTERREKILTFYENLKRNIKNYYNRNCYLLVSGEFTTLAKVKETYMTLKERASLFFYFNGSRCLFLEQLEHSREPEVTLVFEKKNVLQQNWAEHEEEKIRKFFVAAQNALAPTAYVKDAIVRYLYELENYLTQYHTRHLLESLMKGNKFPDYREIDNSDSAALLEQKLYEIVGSVYEAFGQRLNTILQMEEYIRQNYHTTLTLEKIAEKFHMNPAYFSQYFKKHTQKNFIAYLNEVRIEHAKGLLWHSMESTEAIAEAVGIENSNYFVRLFKKLTGETVGQYRKRLK